VTTLRDDVAARFKLRVSLPGLLSRREDVPLVARHLLRRIARMDPEIGARFLEGWNGEDGEPRLSLSLVRRLVCYPYKTHVRELERLLWRSLATTRSDTLELTAELASEMELEGPPRARTPTPDDVRIALDRAGGVKDRAWRDLGLANRWALMRLMKKYGIAGGDADDERPVSEAGSARRA
jgi:DNA-binding NtrC family response regulator